MSASKASVTTPVQLYRYLLRVIKKLPEESRPYYQNYVRQSYNSHSDERDPERLQQIITRSLEDADWIMKKYAVKS